MKLSHKMGCKEALEAYSSPYSVSVSMKKLYLLPPARQIFKRYFCNRSTTEQDRVGLTSHSLHFGVDGQIRDGEQGSRTWVIGIRWDVG